MAIGLVILASSENKLPGYILIGIGFLFAPVYHSAMRYAVKARSEVGIRSIFNMLGPLTNPAAANCQVLGVYAPELTEVFAQTLGSMGVKRAFVVHGHDGLDEISVCASTRVSELQDSRVKTYDISPDRFFGDVARPDEIRGGRPDENALITRSILEKDTPLTPPKANPLTPVAIGLIKAHVQDSVMMISTSNAARSSCCARGMAIIKKLTWTAVLLSTSVENEVARAIKKNNTNVGTPIFMTDSDQPVKYSWILNAYKRPARTTAMPTKRNPLVGSSL